MTKHGQLMVRVQIPSSAPINNKEIINKFNSCGAALLLITCLLSFSKVAPREDTKSLKYIIGTTNVIYSDLHLNRIILGKSNFDISRERDEQRNRDVVAREQRIAQRPSQNYSSRDEGLRLCKEIWGEEECQSLDWIVQHESGWNQYAVNKNCCGLFQRLNRCSEETLSDFRGQLREGMQYITGRYGTAARAQDFWINHRWY